MIFGNHRWRSLVMIFVLLLVTPALSQGVRPDASSPATGRPVVRQDNYAGRPMISRVENKNRKNGVSLNRGLIDKYVYPEINQDDFRWIW